MKALYVNNGLALEDVTLPEPNSGEVRLKIRLGGICNTDLEIVKGYMNFSGVLGHEFVAEVEAGSPDLIGKRVVGEINVACGTCDFCQRGIPSQCRNRTTVGIDRHDGAFAEHMTLTTNNIYVVPDSVTDEQAVFTEPLAAALQILDQLEVTPDDRVVVIGAGKLGMLCAQVLKHTGADLSVIIRHDKQANLLKKWGIRAVTRDMLDSSQATIVVDCTGNEEGFADALDIVQARGTIVLKSTYVGIPKVNLTQVAIDEITVLGSRCGPFATALDYLEKGLIDVESMIEATYPLSDGLVAMEHAAQKGMLKVLLKM
jgi:threonine dehydrogenase-like Zn-dependent dehydrogenase